MIILLLEKKPSPFCPYNKPHIDVAFFLKHHMTCKLGMCLKENYSDSPSNEYSRHYSAESEYPRRQNMNSKLGEKQKKKGHHVRRSPNFDSNSDTEQKNGQNDNALILGRVSINTRPSTRTPLGTSLMQTC